MILLLFLLSSTSVRAAAPLPDLAVKGLHEPEMIRQIYQGRFQELREVSLEDFGRHYTEIYKRARLRYAFFIYHEVYGELCATKTGEPLVKHVRTRYLVTTRGGWEVDRKAVETTEVLVRERFSDAYGRMNNPNQQAAALFFGAFSSGSREISPGDFITSVPVDVRQLIATYGCTSPTIRQYEDNLHRVVLDQGPVQDGAPWPHNAALFEQGCAKVAAELAGSGTADCRCMHRTLSAALYRSRLHELEDNFTREQLLWTAASQSGLVDKLSECFRAKGAKP